MDLIFCGSLLTHFHADRFKESLLHMASWLVDDGLLIVTLHGRWPMWRQAHTPHPYLSPEDFAPIKTGVETDGFGYVDYDSNSDRVGQSRYGLSVSLPAWVMAFLQFHTELRIIDFQERDWDNHQDVLIIQKKKVSAKPWIFES